MKKRVDAEILLLDICNSTQTTRENLHCLIID